MEDAVVAEVLRRFTAAARPGVFLDVDGTLSPIVARPEDARLGPGVRDAVAELLPRMALVAVVSGRPTSEAAALVGVPGVKVLGSYGLGRLPDIPPGLLAAVEAAARRVPGSRVERKGGTVAVHLRGTPAPDAAEAMLADLLTPIARDAQMDVAHGKRVLELVPEGRDLKGEAVEEQIARFGLDAVLYAGDDLADLGAFAALERVARGGVMTTKVAVRGPETPEALLSAADLVVEGPEGVALLLRSIVA
jgi:trehalose 6-phosphate phosphatase